MSPGGLGDILDRYFKGHYEDLKPEDLDLGRMELVVMSAILAVAKAIEGPHDSQGVYQTDPVRLKQLREHRWEMLSEHEQGVRLVEAETALSEAGNWTEALEGLTALKRDNKL